MSFDTITIFDVEQIIEYFTEYDEKCFTKQDAQKEEDGGFSIVLIY